MVSKQDYAIGALLGFLVGVFVIPTFINLEIRARVVLLGLPLVVPILFLFGLWLSNVLSRWLPFFSQLGRFVAVGLLNTAIDFGVLNLLSAATGITAGFILGGVNIPGFSVAVFNSYLWNKLWVFKDRGPEHIFHDFPKFLTVTLVGLLINSGIVVLVTTYVPAVGGLPSQTWLNIAKVAATAVSFIWNFVGYKFIVFRASAVN